MTLSAFLVVYILGGLTFIPLLAAAIIVPAWYLLPRIDGDQQASSRQKDGRDEVTEEKDELPVDELYTGGGATSGTFAVLRSYQFQAATAALNARQASTNAAGVGTGGDGPAETSESVYQSMYRSVFDRNKIATSSNPLIETPATDATTPTRVTRKPAPAPASVFYIVLRHGHLMLYDSPAQLEVRHVISLAQYEVSLSEGMPYERLTDGDLFIKRTAIVLTPLEQTAGFLQSHGTAPKPFYLFSSICTEKEEFYLALLHSRSIPPIPQSLDPADVIKLQSTLHSTSLTPEMRGMNALASRIFLALHRTPFLENLVRSKIEKKMSRVQKPGFIASLELRSIHLGDAAPILSNLRLKDLNISGDLTVGADIRYTGGLKVVIAAQAKIDLGTRFKTRFVDLVLAASLQKLQGHMQFRIKPPPSNRIWFTFDGMPDVDIKVEPVVSQRQITYTFILRAIEERIRGVVAETLVKPNWDDSPFFDTTGQVLRGGIWKDERTEESEMEEESGATPNTRDRKSMSTPALVDVESSGSDHVSGQTATTSGLSKDKTENLKRRSVATLPETEFRSSNTETEERPFPKSLRSPSFAMPSPSTSSVTTDEAARVRADDVPAQPRKWRIRQPQVQQAKRDAVDAVRELHDRAVANSDDDGQAAASNRLSDPDVQIGENGDTESLDAPSESISSKSIGGQSSTSRGDDVGGSESPSLTRAQQQRKTLLAATAAATTAARNWSWNAINRSRGSPSARQGQASVSTSQPMGRGQPLPPPGVPLPGPQKTLWSGLGTVKRKPVPPLPPRRPREDPIGGADPEPLDAQHIPDAKDEDLPETTEAVSDSLALHEEDDFGPWRENSGPELEVPGSSSPGSDVSAEALATPIAVRDELVGEEASSEYVKVPPPLPSRAKHDQRLAAEGTASPYADTATDLDSADLLDAEIPASSSKYSDERGVEDGEELSAAKIHSDQRSVQSAQQSLAEADISTDKKTVTHGEEEKAAVEEDDGYQKTRPAEDSQH